ncbi:MAG: hypothetical protein KJZ83_03575 [Burkholderiaceae bacterium]|nr:hypothetical protein [Burkholderiaceae bacterium]
MPSASIIFTVACVVAFVGLVVAECFRWRPARVVFKLLASSAFVALAWTLPGSVTDYGRLIVAALVLSWLGDVCLLSARSSLFLCGLAAFLLAHVAFAAAFALGAFDLHALVAALAVLVPVGVLTMRWLWSSLSTSFRGAVGAYVTAIVAMCALAVASSSASGNMQVAIGALGFAASDLAVARDQFIRAGILNKLWGLPVYYASQLALAWSIARQSGVAG